MHQLKKLLHHIYTKRMAQVNVQSYLKFIKARSTRLKQKNAAWVAARQDTIGASQIAALTGNSPFETRRSLLQKKIRPVSMHDKTACAWGTLFEPIARKYFEKKHSVQVFGHSVSLDPLDLAKDHPLYKKVTCSTDGYFKNKDNFIVLLEFKCPFKRKIAMYQIPHHYRQQIQTGLAFSGPDVTKACSLTHILECASLMTWSQVSNTSSG